MRVMRATYFPQRLIFPDGERFKIFMLWFLFSSKSYLVSKMACSNSYTGMGSLLAMMCSYLTSSLEVLRPASCSRAAQPLWLWLVKAITDLITEFCRDAAVQETHPCATMRLISISPVAVNPSTSPCQQALWSMLTGLVALGL